MTENEKKSVVKNEANMVGLRIKQTLGALVKGRQPCASSRAANHRVSIAGLESMVGPGIEHAFAEADLIHFNPCILTGMFPCVSDIIVKQKR